MSKIVDNYTEVGSEYDLRDSIFNALNSVYAPYFEGGDWYAGKAILTRGGDTSIEINAQLTTDILALVAFATIDPEHDTREKYYGETMFSRVHQTIWNLWPGGSTAEVAARKVCKILNVEES